MTKKCKRQILTRTEVPFLKGNIFEGVSTTRILNYGMSSKPCQPRENLLVSNNLKTAAYRNKLTLNWSDLGAMYEKFFKKEFEFVLIT